MNIPPKENTFRRKIKTREQLRRDNVWRLLQFADCFLCRQYSVTGG